MKTISEVEEMPRIKEIKSEIGEHLETIVATMYEVLADSYKTRDSSARRIKESDKYVDELMDEIRALKFEASEIASKETGQIWDTCVRDRTLVFVREGKDV